MQSRIETPCGSMHLLHTLLNPRLAVAIATALGTCGFGVSAEPPGFGSNDAVQLKAKAALEKDPVLKNLNLWLSVSDGVVLVNGGVPDEVTKGKIEAVLAKVPGVSVVRVTAWVAPAEDPIRKLVEDRLVGVPDAPLPNKYAAPSLAVNPILPGAVPDEIPGLPVGIGAVPSPASRPTGTVVAQRFDPASVGGFLQPPVVATNGSATLPPGFDVPPPPVGPAAYPTIRATRVPVAPVELSPADAALELLAVRKSDPRFAGLIAVLRNGSALVTGSAATRADAEAFAGAVGKVPGVGRVAVGSIQIR